MKKIEQSKNYTGAELDNIFFRPMFSGDSAEKLGIRLLYNMPVPTILSTWKRTPDVLQKYTNSGWSGGSATERTQRIINMSRVKAEASYSAADYFSLVLEEITRHPGVNMQDLSGTDLEKAETALFKEAIAESIRVTMWLGCADEEEYPYNTFDGFLRKIQNECSNADSLIIEDTYNSETISNPHFADVILDLAWGNASDELRNLKSEGNLVFFVSSDVYNSYNMMLDSTSYEASYLERQNGRENLCWRGIPLIDTKVAQYIDNDKFPHSYAILTDRRNLALAVNTADFPGTEVSMWYNPDEMENRQRAVFMAGCGILMPELVSYIHYAI
jgi:hypothetical protein